MYGLSILHYRVTHLDWEYNSMVVAHASNFRYQASVSRTKIVNKHELRLHFKFNFIFVLTILINSNTFCLKIKTL